VAKREKPSGRKPALAGVKVIFFDVGGTLVCGDLGRLDLLHEALFVVGYDVTREEVARANDLARRAVARRRRRLAAPLDSQEAGRMWLDHLAEALDLDLRGLELAQELEVASGRIEVAQQVTVDPDALWLLGNLRRRGFRLGVISNWHSRLQEDLDDHGLAAFFEKVIASESVGTQKPHREIFLKALAAMECPAKSAIHVGDDYWADVVGARQIGIRPVLVDRDGDALHHDCTVIRSLKDLDALV